jgi:hypothetical protein
MHGDVGKCTVFQEMALESVIKPITDLEQRLCKEAFKEIAERDVSSFLDDPSKHTDFFWMIQPGGCISRR